MISADRNKVGLLIRLCLALRLGGSLITFHRTGGVLFVAPCPHRKRMGDLFQQPLDKQQVSTPTSTSAMSHGAEIRQQQTRATRTPACFQRPFG